MSGSRRLVYVSFLFSRDVKEIEASGGIVADEVVGIVYFGGNTVGF